MTSPIFLASVLASAQARQGDVTIVEVSVEGTLDPEQAHRAALAYKDQLRSCAHLSFPDPLYESMELRVRVDVRRGRVTGVPQTATVHNGPANEDFRACLERKAVLWSLPRVSGTSTLRIEARLDVPVDQATVDRLALASRLPIVAAARRLEEDGQLYDIEPMVLSVLRQDDPCGQARDEFEARSCAEAVERLAPEARKSLEERYVYLTGLVAHLGPWDETSGRFVVTVDPQLVPGGLGTPHAPSLTTGRLRALSSGTTLDLGGGSPITFETPAITFDMARDIVRASDRVVQGVALVKLEDAYEVELDGGFGRARQQDAVTLYGVHVEPVAIEIVDPTTGTALASWLAAGYALEVEGSDVRLVAHDS